MARIERKPFQGVANIVRFNWHFYVIAVASISALIIAQAFASDPISVVISVVLVLALYNLVASLAVSYFVYDRSELYTLNWLNSLGIPSDARLVNIHAGFDETSALLAAKFPVATLAVMDFYDPVKHTEVSIKRARAAYPPYPGTQAISTASVPLAEQSVDCVFVLLAAHEIRKRDERVLFFGSLKRSLKPGGKIIVVEHLRDLPNFLAYTLGFFHFLSLREWQATFSGAGLHISDKKTITPFVSVFILQQHGAQS